MAGAEPAAGAGAAVVRAVLVAQFSQPNGDLGEVGQRPDDRVSALRWGSNRVGVDLESLLEGLHPCGDVGPGARRLTLQLAGRMRVMETLLVTLMSITLAGGAAATWKLLDRIDTKIDGLRTEIDTRLDKVDARFDKIDAKIDAKVDGLSVQLGEINGRVSRIEGHLGIGIPPAVPDPAVPGPVPDPAVSGGGTD